MKKDTKNYVDLKTQPIPEGQHLLEVDNLKMYFHTEDGIVHAVDGVSYTLDRGETLGVVGESGSGKSVTAMTIMGLIPMPPGKIHGGSVKYRGKSLLDMSEEEMQHVRGNDIAMIFQDPMTSLNPVYKIGKQVGEGLRLHRGYSKEQALKRATELLDLVGIPEPEKRVNEYPHQFSGGMRQRVMIAMALACDPDILIADEPTTALDVTVQKQVVDLLNKLQKELGFAMVFVSHDLALVAEVANSITVMYAGQVVEQGSVNDILTNPVHEYTRGLLGSVLSIEAGGSANLSGADSATRLHQIPGSVPSPKDFPEGDRFTPRSSHPDKVSPVRPVLKTIPGTHHCYAELPAEELKRLGIEPYPAGGAE